MTSGEILNIPKINWDGKPFEFQQGSGLMSFKNGLLHRSIHLNGRICQCQNSRLIWAWDGIERISITRLQKQQVTLSSAMATSAIRRSLSALTKSRTIDSSGFSATWNISALATNAQATTDTTGTRQAAWRYAAIGNRCTQTALTSVLSNRSISIRSRSRPSNMASCLSH